MLIFLYRRSMSEGPPEEVCMMKRIETNILYIYIWSCFLYNQLHMVIFIIFIYHVMIMYITMSYVYKCFDTFYNFF